MRIHSIPSTLSSGSQGTQEKMRRRLALLFPSNNGGGRGFAIVAQIGQRILYARHFLDVPRNRTALLLSVLTARIHRCYYLCESSLARIGKVREVFLDAGGDTTTSRLDIAAGLFDVRRASAR